MYNISLKGLIASIALFLSGFSSLLAQDFKADMKALGTLLKDANYLSSDIIVKVIGISTGEMKKTALLRKSGDTFYYKLDDTEMLLTPDVYIVVDNIQKIVLAKSINERQRMMINRQILSNNIDSLMQLYDSVSYNGLSGGQKSYSIYFSKQAIQRALVSISTASGFLNKIEMFYNPKLKTGVSKVTVEYSPLQTTPIIASKYLEESNYIIRQGRKWTLSSKYKTYQLKVSKS